LRSSMVGFAHESKPRHLDPLTARTMPLTMSIARRSSVIEAFERAKAGMGRECDVVHGGKRVIESQRFGVEHVEAGVADAAAPQPIDERVLIDQRATRRIDEDRARLHARHLSRPEKSVGVVVEREVQRNHVGANKQFVERDQSFAGARRAIPRNDLHPQPAADAQNLAADTAQPDDAEGLAKELHAFARRPGAGTDLPIHPRDVATTC